MDVAAYFFSQPLTLTGWRDGVQVASVTVDLDQAGWTNGIEAYKHLEFDAAWGDVDQVRFDADLGNDFTMIDNVRVAGPAGNEDTAFDIDVMANDHDPDTGDVLALSSFDGLSAMGAAITLNPDGTLRYDPTAA